ncbi:MAG: FAD:protein FMN transferase [Saprospiraceae bacterium]|nr:FAD:protein FMN transferase [Saprospiraceae bacterium]
MTLLYPKLGLLSITLWTVAGCFSPTEQAYPKISGFTMGTTYQITYNSESSINQGEVDALLLQINAALSTYIDSSLISRFNQSISGLILDQTIDSLEKAYFLHNLELALDICQGTDGWFDPTVMPLVNYWGFGYVERSKKEYEVSDTLQSLLKRIGCDKISISKGEIDHIGKQHELVELDFSAIAKGFAVDVLADYLQSQGSQDYLIDIGGEVKAAGLNHKDHPWSVGVNRPSETAKPNEIIAIISLDRSAMATSGNYRNYYRTDQGQTVSHTLNPKSGMPERNDLLSVTIVSDDCATADAYATACLAMGLEKAKKLVENSDFLECLLIYSDSNGHFLQYVSDGLRDNVEIIH